MPFYFCSFRRRSSPFLCSRSNVKKKWAQVWPNTPFPDETDKESQERRGGLSMLIRLNAGDAVDIFVPEDGIGSIRVIPKHHTQSQVARFALERSSGNTHTM
jgi:hypothetical protein